MADTSMADETAPVCSFAAPNRELAAAYERYMLARGNRPMTIRAYNLAVSGLLESLAAKSVSNADTNDIRQFLLELLQRGCTPNTIRLRTAALRAFFRFLRLTGSVQIDPMARIPHRKIPHRLQRVLTVAEVERLLAAARNPLERAVLEVLYSTGVRISELVKIRLEDIDFADGQTGSIRVIKGKGGKDRFVLFGSKAAEAIREYQKWRPSESGFLFEAKRESPIVQAWGSQWWARVCVAGRVRRFKVGPRSDFPSRAHAQAAAELLISKMSGYQARPARAYVARTIHQLVSRVAMRAGIGCVYPHMLRRAFACHMLQGGANIRAIQELLGHELITTTTIYTHLTANDLQAVHTNAHPHGDSHGEQTKA